MTWRRVEGGRIRASESERALLCPASLVRPRNETRNPAAVTAGNYGTLAHYWKETGDWCPDWADEKDISLLGRKLAITGVKRETYWEGGEHEVTFALNLLSLDCVRYTGPREGADEWKKARTAPHVLTGTIDYYVPQDLVDDLKTGRWLPAVDDSKQLKSYALLSWAMSGFDEDWVTWVSFTHWEKYPLAGLPKVTSHLMTAAEAQEHLEALRWAVSHPNEVNPGAEQCRFCPCRNNCPEALEIP